ncbi:MAG: hypothetical protein KatS3mg076_2216 [Candidatus Binatia bacterium]|nr:MAG: hypothetical protein KatS3mg076_2216 [Candidatus Binatia bacterium]
MPEGSAGARVARLVPGARVVSALKTLSAEHLQELAKPLEGDVFLCSDDPEAKAFVAEIVSRLVNLRPLDAGPLRLGAVVEGITALLLNLNRRYKAVTSVRILGLEHVTRSR